MLTRASLAAFPGGEMVAAGLDDLADGRETIAAFVVRLGAMRRRAAGLEVPPEFDDPERRLHETLARAAW